MTGVSESQYKAAHDFLEKKGCKQVGTLSADEWEVAGLYIAYAFEKVEEKSSHDNRKRHRDHSSESSSSKRNRKGWFFSIIISLFRLLLNFMTHQNFQLYFIMGHWNLLLTKEILAFLLESVEEVYEVKDEIYDAEADMEVSTGNFLEVSQKLFPLKFTKIISPEVSKTISPEVYRYF